MGKSIKPDWGLFNGSVGTGIEIIYEKNASLIETRCR
jgi:hypothetical protein